MYAIRSYYDNMLGVGPMCISRDMAKNLKRGNHDCLGQYGATTIPVALSDIIFLKTRKIRRKGVNA